MSFLRKAFVALTLLLPLGLPACTSQTTDDFENPPPGPPASCAASALVTGCTGGSQGYVCAGDRPDDGDTNLVCSDGTEGAAGTTLYCCAPYGQYWSDCTVDTSIEGCGADAFGFKCSGPEGPGDADASIVCSAPVASGADTLYCCNAAVLSPTCAADPTVTGCTGASIGYSCAGAGVPDQSDTELSCSVGMPGAAGVTQFCCLPFAQSAGTCQEDDAVTGCAPGSYGFSCTGSATPSQVDPALVCGAGVSGLFCCNLGTK